MEAEHEYRVLHRPEGSTADWSVVRTRHGADRRYRTLSAARAQVTREKARDSRRMRTSARPYPAQEYKIQRRPVSVEWEDIPS